MTKTIIENSRNPTGSNSGIVCCEIICEQISISLISNKFHNLYDMANSDIDIIMISKIEINDIFPESVLHWLQI